MKVTLAFEKGTSLIARVIQLVTWSKYSHVEIIIEDNWISSGEPAGVGLKVRPLRKLKNRYEYIEVEVDNRYLQNVYDFIEENKNTSYDYLGSIFGGGFNIDIHYKDKWFCSELVAMILRRFNVSSIDQPASTYSPVDLYRLFR